MNKKISKVGLLLVSVLALSSCSLFSAEKQRVNQLAEITPFPATVVSAEFPETYSHSYTFMHPSTMKFEVGMDTDVFDGAILTKDGQQLVRFNDLVLSGCKGDPADCSIDTTVPFTADEMYEQMINNYDRDQTFKPLLAFPMPSNNVVQITAYESREDDKNTQFYIVNVGAGVLSVTFYAPEKLPEGFIGDILASLKPSK